MVFKAILGYMDRLSTKSVLTGYTGSICGFLATLLLIIISCIIFIPPAVNYFQGDYFQSQFLVINNNSQNQQYNTGSQIKLAIVFKNKQTDIVADHSKILSLTTSGYFMNFNNELFLNSLEKCQPNYFAGQLNGIILKDCIMIPSNLLFNTNSLSGIFMTLSCQNPFGCQNQQQYKFFLDLFKNNYYQVYFHSKTFLKDGTSTYEVFKIYSTQYSSQDGLSSSIRLYFDKEKTQMDVSVMPWRNNIKFQNLAWNGLANGASLNSSDTITQGAQVSYSNSGFLLFVNRYYKKLDWLIGIIGGGVFILFIIFYIPCSQVNKILQKIYNSRKLMVQSKVHPYQSIDNLERLSYNPLFYLLGCLPNIPPFSLIPCFLNNRRSILISQNKLSIVNILKKLNCAEKNLQINNSYDSFQSRELLSREDNLNPIQPDENIEVSESIAPHLQNLQISKFAYQTLNQSNKSQQIYQNNPTVLALLQKKDSLQQISIDQKYDRQDGHLKKASQPWYQHIKRWSAKILRGFDIFGAQPNFSATPQNYSCFGFISTLIIVVLAVLTFCMTLYNMGKSYKIVQYDKVPADDIQVKLKTGPNYGLMICFPDYAFQEGLLQGNTKAIDIKFVQYHTNKAPQYFTPIRLTENSLYIFSKPQNLSNCYKIPDGQNLQVKGGSKSSSQAYFGISLRPYCFGTVSSCTTQNSTFLNAMNKVQAVAYISSEHYNPQQKIMEKKGFSVGLNNNEGQVTHQNHTIQEVIFFSHLQVIDDTSSFNYPQVTLEGLYIAINHGQLISLNNAPQDLEYRFFIKCTGQVIKVIERSYKVHFLLGVIGGCFLFYYFIFHWLAKIYNSWNPRAKLAHFLYSQPGYNECCCFMWCGLGCLPNSCFPQNFKKKISRIRLAQLQMKKQLNEIQLAKKIDNCWKLSSSLYPNIQSKDLSLLYFRQVIQSNEQVRSSGLLDHFFQGQPEFQEPQDDMENPASEFESFQQQHSHHKIMSKNTHSQQLISEGTQNVLNQGEKELNQHWRQREYYDDSPDPADFKNKYARQAYRWIQQLDLFKIRGQFTFEGHRQVKSIFGGVCCLILTIGILVIIWNFFIAYSNGIYYSISQQTQVTSSDNSERLDFEVGKNFKFMFTFAQSRDFQFKNVSSYEPYISIQAQQVTIKRVNNHLSKTFSQPYDFTKCSSNYLDGFYGQFLSQFKYYQNITNGYCLPNNLKFSIAGGPSTDQYKYFYFTIHPKNTSQDSFDKYKQFTNNYSINYHYLNPTINLHSKAIQYQIVQQNQNQLPYQRSFQMNMSLNKIIIENSRVHSQALNTYGFSAPYADNYKSYFLTPQIAWKNITMNYNNLVTTFKVQFIQPSQFLGIIGGVCAIFVFFVWGCASSFNQYRMKYLIGKKLYRFQVTQTRFKKRAKEQIQQDERKYNNYSQLDILHAWIISIRGFIQDYNFNEKLRHITLIQQRVEEQLNIFNFYRRLYAVESSLNKKISLNPAVKLTKVYFKDIFNNMQEPYTTQRMRRVAETNFLSSYEQNKLDKAYNSKRVIPVKVIGINYLDNIFFKDQNRSDAQSYVNESQSHFSLSQDNQKKNKNSKQISKEKMKENIRESHQGIIQNQQEDIQEKVEAIHQREREEMDKRSVQKSKRRNYQRRKLAPIKKKQQTPEQIHQNQQYHYQADQQNNHQYQANNEGVSQKSEF